MLLKRADSHTSAARCVRQNRITGPAHSQDKSLVADALNMAGKTLKPFTDFTEQSPPQAIFEIDKPRNTAGKKTMAGKTV